MLDTIAQEAPLANSWAELNLNEISTDRDPADATTTRSELPAPANYKLKLMGAKQNPYQSGTTDIDFQVVDGPFARKRLFASLPSPAKGKWVAQAAAFLIKRLGITQQPGEDLIDTLSRGAANGAGLITADVMPDSYVSKTTGETVTKPKLQYFSIQAAI